MAGAEDRRYAYRVWCGNLRESGHLVDIAVLGKVILHV
jgi:hypothetical protein